MTKNNIFFSEEQVKLSEKFFKESAEKIRVENMLEKFGYSYKYEKTKCIKRDYIFISIYTNSSFYLGAFIYQDFFDDFGACTSIYNLLENFGYVMRELKNE